MLIPLSLGVEIFTTGTPFGATSNLVLCAEFGSTTKLAANISMLYINKNIIVINTGICGIILGIIIIG